MSCLPDIQRRTNGRTNRRTNGRTNGQGRLLWTPSCKPGVQYYGPRRVNPGSNICLVELATLRACKWQENCILDAITCSCYRDGRIFVLLCPIVNAKLTKIWPLSFMVKIHCSWWQRSKSSWIFNSWINFNWVSKRQVYNRRREVYLSK